jgi:hypothetical protein
MLCRKKNLTLSSEVHYTFLQAYPRSNSYPPPHLRKKTGTVFETLWRIKPNKIPISKELVKPMFSF